MREGDMWTDENGVKWTVTGVTDNTVESVGNPPPPKIVDIPASVDIVELEAAVTDLIQALADKGVI